jgi:hypothetical protein
LEALEGDPGDYSIGETEAEDIFKAVYHEECFVGDEEVAVDY